MTPERIAEIRDYIDGFMAWDKGCVSSGIKDDTRREEVRKHLVALATSDGPAFRALVKPIVFMYDTFEDVQETLDWLREFLEFDDWSGL